MDYKSKYLKYKLKYKHLVRGGSDNLPRLKRIRSAPKSYNPNWSELNDTDYDEARNSEWEVLDENIPTDEYILGSDYRHKVRNPHLLRLNTTSNISIPKLRRSRSVPKLKRQRSFEKSF